MRVKVIAAAAGLVLATGTSAHAGEPSMTWKQAEAKTLAHYSPAVTVHWVCANHHANDHYWRVGFCTGKHNYKSARIVADVRQGEQARIALAEGKPFTVFAYNVVCPRGCPRPYV